MRKIIYFYTIFFLSYGASCQDNGTDENGNSAIYLSSPVPYTLANHKSTLSLPDSLTEEGTGNVVLDIFLDNDGRSEGFSIKYLRLINNNLDTLKYYKYSDLPLKKVEYPMEVQKFFPFFSGYVSELKVIKKKNVKIYPNVKYLITAPITLE